MTIDFHTHVFPDEIAAQVVATLESKTKEKVDPSGDGTTRQLLQQMDEAGIDQAVLCPIATKPEQFESILKFSLKILKGERGEKEQSRLIPFASVHPRHPESFKQLDQIAASGIRGIKLHPYYQEFTLRDKRVIELLRCCRDLNLTILCHCGQDIGFPPSDRCTPRLVAEIYQQVEGIRFIAAHMGGWRMWDEVMQHLVGRAIYMDTAVLAGDLQNPTVQELLHTHPAEYLLLASDWPWCPLQKAVEMVRKCKRSEKEQKLILGGNAQRLMRC